MPDESPQPWLKPPIVVKVGGSLFDWPELQPRLRLFLAGKSGTNVLLIPGGGKTADAVRELHRIHGLSEEAAHWLALQSLTLNAHALAEMLPGVQVIEGLNAARSAWRRGGATILDAFRFARGDEMRPGHLPHIWAAASDSLAARAATVAEAGRLLLLKSASFPSDDWAEAARIGYVDAHFPTAIAGAAFAIEAINLRAMS